MNEVDKLKNKIINLQLATEHFIRDRTNVNKDSIVLVTNSNSAYQAFMEKECRHVVMYLPLIYGKDDPEINMIYEQMQDNIEGFMNFFDPLWVYYELTDDLRVLPEDIKSSFAKGILSDDFKDVKFDSVFYDFGIYAKPVKGEMTSTLIGEKDLLMNILDCLERTKLNGEFITNMYCKRGLAHNELEHLMKFSDYFGFLESISLVLGYDDHYEFINSGSRSVNPLLSYTHLMNFSENLGDKDCLCLILTRTIKRRELDYEKEVKKINNWINKIQDHMNLYS